MWKVASLRRLLGRELGGRMEQHRITRWSEKEDFPDAQR